MSSYEGLAASYDALTTDVGYEKRADFLEKLFRRSRIPVHTVLDLACGTGTMTWLLTQRGYEVIGVDGSEDMLAAAMSKGGQAAGVPPVFLHQSMPKLDLYGTVDAAVCCLDSLNYLTDPEDVRRTFRRLTSTASGLTSASTTRAWGSGLSASCRKRHASACAWWRPSSTPICRPAGRSIRWRSETSCRP